MTRPAGLFYLCLSVCICGSFPLWATDWPQFLGPERNGVSAETGLVQAWPKAGPPLLWEKMVGDGYSGPVIAGGAVVAFYRSGGSEVVECLDAATGKGRWKYEYPTSYRDAYGKGDGPRSTPL